MTQPQPTVFLSYASEDREAVLLLRDALTAAGLDVWYDANELGGGDAWDQKIRRQIRECDFFVPVISATTQRRKEGYFRREWRLAAERTLDMADDVMFLLPIVLDHTTEAGARVPEKFVSVQWLRVPGGTPTPALQALARRLAEGDHAVPPKIESTPPFARSSQSASTAAGKPGHDARPPLPPFPHMAEKGNFSHVVKYCADVIGWAVTAGMLLFRRAPRWLRVVISIWFCFLFIARCSHDSSEPEGSKRKAKSSAANTAETRQAVSDAAEKLAALGKPADGAGPDAGTKLAAFGSDVARKIADGMQDADLAEKQIVAVPFGLGITDADAAKFPAAVFTPLYGRLAVERAGETGVFGQPLPVATAEALVALGQRLDSHYVLGAQLVFENGEPLLTVRLVKVASAAVVWTAQYPVAGSDPAAVAEEIATGVLGVVTK